MLSNLTDKRFKKAFLDVRVYPEGQELDEWDGHQDGVDWVGFANGLSTAELAGQWIDRQLVVRRHGSDTPIYWEDDHVGELLSASWQFIIGVKAGRRVKFLELVCA